MDSNKISVLLIDDDPLVRASLKIIVEAEGSLRVIGSAGEGGEAARLFDDLQPDILLMDIRMRPVDGLTAGEQILRRHPQARILYLTTFADDEYIIKALHMGARGYILKQDFESIAPAIKAVHAGQSVFGDPIMAKIPVLLADQHTIDPSRFELRDKELELIALIAEGLNNREIAARLYLSEGTIRNQLSVILEKLNLRDRTQLAVFYYKSGLERET
ncbi:MAG: response regulator transcription factor [Clostridiaceae bacterium]|nr:response regulator transcription factor [Clostridiaceae bacterium]